MSSDQSNVVTGHHGVALVTDVYPHTSRDKPPVILLHGGGQNRHAWTKTARTIHAAGHHVVAYDTRGHGDSSWDPSGRYDTDDLAHDLLAVRDHCCGSRPSPPTASPHPDCGPVSCSSTSPREWKSTEPDESCNSCRRTPTDSPPCTTPAT